MRRRIVIGIVVVAGVAALLTWRLTRGAAGGDEIVVHGNVDLRQVNLSFNNNERIAAVLVEEGEHVGKGEVVAKLDTSRLEPQVAAAQGMDDAQKAAVDRLHNGNRPEEIAQAKANLDSSQADAANAKQQYQRLVDAKTSGASVSAQDLEIAKAASQVADAKVLVNQKALELEVAGPRKEDVEQGEAQLRADDAQVALLKEELGEAQLLAPCDGVVRSRLMEAGEMASPQTPVFSLAVTDPKWVRAYVAEGDLGNVHSGMAATVSVDSFANRPFDGWVGFISPMAEFTPKEVQTEELRTSLVYEIRVYVKDPKDELRLGMPATVHLLLHHADVSGATTEGLQ